MLRQVRLNHRVFDATNPSISFPRRVFAFGTHELAVADEIQPEVTSGIVVNNALRLVIDELLVGNNLEEIACRIPPHDPATGRVDAFQQVPLGANPDDISRCSVADDVLFSSCQGSTAVCICQNPMGCPRSTTCNDADPLIPKCSPGSTCTGGVCVIDLGQPVGVLDINQDGATDDTRMMAGAIGLQCGSIDVPIDLDSSYWNPSGDQNRPAAGGFDALGPAIVLSPLGPMPTNLPCNLKFAPTVVDKENRQLCAPAGGDITASCTEGDLSAFTFRTEALALSSASWVNGDSGVNRTDPALFSVNAPLAVANIGNITVTQAGAPFTAFTVTLMMPQLLQITWDAPGLAADTLYEVTITPQVTDTFDQGLPAPQIFTFTTGA
jgi:hypothetical protein